MNIFVGGLLQDVTNERLEKAFGAYGRVSSASIVKDHPTGSSRGFAYVEMPVNGEAIAAIAALNGHTRLGGSLEVHEICRPAPRVWRDRVASRKLAASNAHRQTSKTPAAQKA